MSCSTGIDFEVAAGSVFSMLGPNGAGKTTTANVLTTLLKADAGTARVAGFNVATETRKVRSAIGVTGQFAAVDELLSGRENLRLMADLLRVRPAAKLVDRLLERAKRSRPTGLARAAGADHGAEPVLGDQVADGGDIGVPADEAGELDAQVGLAALLSPPQLAAEQGDLQGGQLRRRVDTERVGQGLLVC